MAVAGIVASSSLVSRRISEEELEMANARLKRAQDGMERVKGKLLAGVEETAVQVVNERSGKQVELKLVEWVNHVFEQDRRSDEVAPKKTSFV